MVLNALCFSELKYSICHIRINIRKKNLHRQGASSAKKEHNVINRAEEIFKSFAFRVWRKFCAAVRAWLTYMRHLLELRPPKVDSSPTNLQAQGDLAITQHY
jgi:hypothetical protein